MTVVSAAACAPRGQQLHPEVQEKGGGGTLAWTRAESQPSRMGCCSWDAKMPIEKLKRVPATLSPLTNPSAGY